jgi:aminoglycoside phosphotransferase (APT) family kinase protein
MPPAIPPDTSKWPTAEQITHNRAQAVDIRALTQFLESLGYSVLQLEQRWRHVHGLLARDDSQLFFKLASTAEIGAKTQNEVAWNRAVAEPLLELSEGTLIVPKIRGQGFHNDNFFYLADYYTGEFPADHDPPRTDALPRHLSSLVKIALLLNKLSNDTLWGAEGQSSSESLLERFLNEVDRWQRDSGRSDLHTLRELVQPLKQMYLPRLSHGDFVPWHVILHGEKLVLIDGEHAWSGRPQYYDVAYFYHRLSTSAARPDLAKRFLSEFFSGLPESEKSTFWARFVPLIAARSIAGFYDATLFEDQRNVIDMHETLRAMIVSNDLC